MVWKSDAADGRCMVLGGGGVLVEERYSCGNVDGWLLLFWERSCREGASDGWKD